MGLSFCASIVAVFLVVSAQGFPKSLNDDSGNVYAVELLKLLNVPQDTELLGFSYSNCGSSSDPVQIQSLAVGPDPVVLGKNVTFSFKASTSVQISAAKADVILEKKVFGVYAKIPCVDNIGSCTYPDVCSFLKPEPCPPPFVENNVPCYCPIPAGTYSMPTTSVPTTNPGISWLTNGDYKAQATLTAPNGQRLICLVVTVSLKS